MADDTSPNPLQRLLSTSKDLLPIALLLWNAVYGFGFKSSTSDRIQQQQAEDHIAITEIRTQLSKMAEAQAAMQAKVDMLIAQEFKR